MRILLTNDDGIYAPGLVALEREARKLGDVCVVAPQTEQSGVGHSITFLRPLVVNEIFDGRRRRGWAVEGSPADCVKLGVFEYCTESYGMARPDLVLSGVNGGLNAGINVLYSGTVAAAIEGAFFGITSVAVSLEFSEHADYERAAALARRVIEQIIERKGGAPQLYNLNIPSAALRAEAPQVRVVPMGLDHYGEKYEKRIDPRGREYFWAANDRDRRVTQETDLSELAQGHMTLTPLDFDLTKRAMLSEMQTWAFPLTL